MKNNLFFKFTLALLLMSFLTSTSFAQAVLSKEGQSKRDGDLVWVNIGNASSPYGTYNYPIDTYSYYSLTQAIYRKADINHAPCNVTQIKYQYCTVHNHETYTTEWGQVVHGYPDGMLGDTIKVWLSNTTGANLNVESGSFLPLDNFQQVFDGVVKLANTEGADPYDLAHSPREDWIIELDQPFTYNGGDLVVMVERESDSTYENHYNFKASNYAASEDKVARIWAPPFNHKKFPFDLLPLDEDSTQYQGMTLNSIADLSFGFVTTGGGSLTGTVTANNGTEIDSLENVKVQIAGTDLVQYTDEDGKYDFTFLNPGNYDVILSKHGYANDTVPVTIVLDQVATENVLLVALEKATVAGKVIDKDGNPIEGVRVVLDGYDNYVDTTNTEGMYNIEGVYYSAEKYAVTFEKEFYVKATTELEKVDQATITIADFTLADKLISPERLLAEKADANVKLTWVSPHDRKMYRYDGDSLKIQIGANFSHDISVMGAVYPGDAKLYKASWMTHLQNNGQDQPLEKVNIWVFKLDANGKPTKEIVFYKRNIPNRDDVWSSYYFEEPIEIEGGFFLALSANERLDIGISEGDNPDYPFVPGVNFVTNDYSSGKFSTLLQSLNVPSPDLWKLGNLKIRAEGYNTATGKALGADKSYARRKLINYTIYRFAAGQENVTDEWVTLKEDATGAEFTDDKFSTLSQGNYRYAIKANYSGSKASDTIYSNIIGKDVSTTVSVTVTTDVNDPATGAIVTLTNQNNAEMAYVKEVYNADGKVTFTNVPKATYKLNVKLDGFKAHEEADLDFSADAEYTKEVKLKEIIVKPYNLEIVEGDKVTFNWNITAPIVEDFESYGNFEVAPSSEKTAWKYVDVDQLPTIGIEGITYPFSHEAMAFMNFNAKVALGDELYDKNPSLHAHSGLKYLMGFGTATGENNDFMISPKLNFPRDFTMKFFVKSYSADPALPKYKIGYSKKTNKVEDFEWLTAEPVEAPHMVGEGNYKEVSYEFPKDVKYVCINNVSKDGWLLMIDDITIAPKEETRKVQEFEVYLDDELQGKVSANTYVFENLESGEHEAGVVAVYKGGKSEKATIKFGKPEDPTAINDAVKESAAIYPTPADDVFSVKGNFDTFAIYDMTGKVIKSGDLTNQQVNISDLANGVYVTKLKNANETVTLRLVVKH